MGRVGAVGVVITCLILAIAAAPAWAASQIAVSDVAFGNVTVGSTSGALTVTVMNTGNADLDVTGTPVITGTGAGSFSVSTDNCAPYPRTLSASGSCTYQVTFTPTSRGAKSANLTVPNNSAGGDSVAQLSGTGVAPVVGVSPTQFAFGEARIGTPSDAHSFTISNNTTDSQNLVITNIALVGGSVGDFAIVINSCLPFPKNVTPGSLCTLQVRFAPTAIGVRTTNLRITSNDPVTPTLDVPLSGTGTNQTLAVTPASLSFGHQVVGATSAAQTLTIANTGTLGDLVLNSIALAGANPADFSIENNLCTPPKTLAPGESCTLGVRFGPTTTGARDASIVVTSDAGPGAAGLGGDGDAPTTISNSGTTTPTDTGTGAPAESPPVTTGTTTPSAPTTETLVQAPARCVVPNLKGKTLAAAKRALLRAHCRLGKVTQASTRRKPRVLRQSRKRGARLPARTRVALVLA